MILPERAAPPELTYLINQASIAPFATDLLEADEALWGSFWQGDVLAPGYTLPAVELALLRATRLDRTWPEETTVIEFVADLHTAIRHPQTGVWTLRAAGEPCMIFAAPFSILTVVWYCETTRQIHAGYRAVADTLNFPGAVELRALDVPGASHPKITHPPAWLQAVVDLDENPGSHSLAARLDAEILRLRLQGYFTRPGTE